MDIIGTPDKETTVTCLACDGCGLDPICTGHMGTDGRRIVCECSVCEGLGMLPVAEDEPVDLDSRRHDAPYDFGGGHAA